MIDLHLYRFHAGRAADYHRQAAAYRARALHPSACVCDDAVIARKAGELSAYHATAARVLRDGPGPVVQRRGVKS